MVRELKGEVFFKDYLFAHEEIMKLLKKFEKENKSDSIWKATKEQYEAFREFLVDMEMQTNSYIASLPREFLLKYLYVFSDDQMNLFLSLIKRYTIENGTDSYLSFTDEQQKELRDTIRECARKNIYKYLEKHLSKESIVSLSEFEAKKSQVNDEITKVINKINEEQAKLNNLFGYLLTKLNDLHEIANSTSFDEIIERQNQQISTLRTKNWELTRRIEELEG